MIATCLVAVQHSRRHSTAVPAETGLTDVHSSSTCKLMTANFPTDLPLIQASKDRI